MKTQQPLASDCKPFYYQRQLKIFISDPNFIINDI